MRPKVIGRTCSTLAFAAIGALGCRPSILLADDPTVLVVFDSRTGNTERLARAVAEGVSHVEGVRGILRRRDEASDEEIRSSSGILLGSPVHWGSLSAETKAFLERVGDVLVRAKELGPESHEARERVRSAGAFVTGGSPSSGKELARLAILAAFLNMRFVVVGGEDGEGFGTLGAQATTGPSDPGVSEEELAEARRCGERFARVTLALVR
jgi:NAD(P)H dehydrogenase (quinone)